MADLDTVINDLSKEMARYALHIVERGPCIVIRLSAEERKKVDDICAESHVTIQDHLNEYIRVIFLDREISEDKK